MTQKEGDGQMNIKKIKICPECFETILPKGTDDRHLVSCPNCKKYWRRGELLPAKMSKPEPGKPLFGDEDA